MFLLNKLLDFFLKIYFDLISLLIWLVNYSIFMDILSCVWEVMVGRKKKTNVAFVRSDLLQPRITVRSHHNGLSQQK